MDQKFSDMLFVFILLIGCGQQKDSIYITQFYPTNSNEQQNFGRCNNRQVQLLYCKRLF